MAGLRKKLTASVFQSLLHITANRYTQSYETDDQDNNHNHFGNSTPLVHSSDRLPLGAEKI